MTELKPLYRSSFSSSVSRSGRFSQESQSPVQIEDRNLNVLDSLGAMEKVWKDMHRCATTVSPAAIERFIEELQTSIDKYRCS